jgi:hypothetical protein
MFLRKSDPDRHKKAGLKTGLLAFAYAIEQNIVLPTLK